MCPLMPNAMVVAQQAQVVNRVRALLNAPVSINDSTLSVLSWTNVDIETPDDMWDIGAPSRITAKTAGVYIVTCGVSWAADADGWRGVGFRFNGGGWYNWQQQNALSVGGVQSNVATAGIFPMAVNEYVEAWVFQTAGNALNVAVSDGSTGNLSNITAAKIGPL